MDTVEHKEIKKVERLLGNIEENTKPNLRRAVTSGFLYGIGVVFGTVGAVIFLGWVLSLLNIIPGFGELAEQVQTVIQSRY